MEKILVVGDTHLGLYQSKDTWLNITLGLFREIVDVCQRKDIYTILHLGDFFHERKILNIKTLAVAQEIASILSPVKMFLLGGNHDSFYKDRPYPTAIDVFEDVEHIHTIVDGAYNFSEEITMVPWFGDISQAKGLFCFGHFEISGFPINNVQYCFKGPTEAKIFKRFSHVYSGHFHMPSNKENITYLGSPFQQRFTDSGSTRGYYIFDNGEMEFIEFKDAPKFIVQHTDKKFTDMEGNIVKLIYDRDYGTNKNNKVLEEIESLKPLELKVDFSNIKSETEENIIDGDISLLDHNDIIKEYVMEKAILPENINKKMLLTIIEKLRKEGE